MPKFLVERYLPAITAAEVEAAVDRVSHTGRAGVRHLFTVLLTGEDTGLSCFEADSPGAVAEINDAAGFPFDRIIDVTVFPSPA